MSLVYALPCAYMDLRSSVVERNVVHGNFHQMEAAPVFGSKVFESQMIANSVGVESMPLISGEMVIPFPHSQQRRT